MRGNSRTIWLLAGVLVAGVTACDRIKSPRQPSAFSKLVIEDAAFDDTARLLNIRKLSGSLQVHEPFESFTLAAALYREGKRVPISIAGGGLSFADATGPCEISFVLAGIDLDYVQLGDGTPSTSRLLMTLQASHDGRGTGTAGPAVRNLTKDQFDVSQIRGQILFNDRHFPRGDLSLGAVIPLAAWVTGDGPIGGYSYEAFNMDAFAAHQLRAGDDTSRAVLVFYLDCLPERK